MRFILRHSWIFICGILLFLASSVLAQDRCMTSAGIGFSDMAREYDDDALLYIPVVFHILYRDSTQYFSDDQVQSQLDVLNADFSLSDSISIPGLFSGIAADTKIRFCLAELDGEPSIGRKLVTQSEIGFSGSYYQTRQGGLDPVGLGEVLNIWVSEIQSGGDVAGFASMPTETPEAQDGIVIDYRYFGVGGAAISPFDRGRTLTHEVGHWLGLRHIWGNMAGCDSSDFIDDTPLQYDRYRGCPTWPQITCGSEDMFMNFMDLTDDACMSFFTSDQKAAMRSTLQSIRSGVAREDPCQITTSLKEDRDHTLIYPNPFYDYIQIPPQLPSAIVTCHSIGGRQIYQGRAPTRINTSDWQTGIYFITIQGATKSKTFKMLKVR